MESEAKKEYENFCLENYVPVFSKSWWLDTICGPDNWDVWIYRNGGKVWAAMPYYRITDGFGTKIGRAPLTQNNGIIISYPKGQKIYKRQSWEEKVCQAAIDYIESLDLRSYEQQFNTSFQNTLPFFWNYYNVTPRYTYVIGGNNIEEIESEFSAKLRNELKKGMKNIAAFEEVEADEFYSEHEKIFLKQGLECPFSRELWFKLHDAVVERNAGNTLAAKDKDGCITSLAFFVKDEKKQYLLLGGAMPEFSHMQTYTALIHKGITMALNENLCFDFEGSVIRRVNRSIREFGGKPMLYYRIRKVFDPVIIKQEADEAIKRMEK